MDSGLSSTPGLISAAASAPPLVLRTQAALLAREPLNEAATALCVELAQALGCTRVSVGLLDGDSLTVIATSAGQWVDDRQSAATALVAAMHEALDQSRTLVLPHAAPALAPVLLAHQRLAAASGATGTCACTVPLKGTTGVIGALCFERAGEPFDGQAGVLEDVASFAGPVLELKRMAAMSWWRRVARALRRRWRDGAGRQRAIAAGAGALALALLLAWPMAYHVSAPARLEGSVQRAIVAAADGFLQQANVRAGDRVKEGQVLAELAADDLLLERRRRQSELAQHENAYRAALARNDRAQMVVAQSRAGEAQAMLALADSQLARSRIVAPFDGVVIKGDLSQTLGAPVQRGEVLLTIAPDNSFRLIVEVDESDIAAVRPGQRGRLALAAMPDTPLDFVTRRIVPVAATAQTRNYFEVEAALEPAAGGAGNAGAAGATLRPGLSGVARIEAGRASLAWQLTHRAFDWLRLALWSAGF